NKRLLVINTGLLDVTIKAVEHYRLLLSWAAYFHPTRLIPDCDNIISGLHGDLFNIKYMPFLFLPIPKFLKNFPKFLQCKGSFPIPENKIFSTVKFSNCTKICQLEISLIIFLQSQYNNKLSFKWLKMIMKGIYNFFFFMKNKAPQQNEEKEPLVFLHNATLSHSIEHAIFGKEGKILAASIKAHTFSTTWRTVFAHFQTLTTQQLENLVHNFNERDLHSKQRKFDKFQVLGYKSCWIQINCPIMFCSFYRNLNKKEILHQQLLLQFGCI
ncbi:hypothetical protein RFI_00845, partial [Reticulomyxa filosa]